MAGSENYFRELEVWKRSLDIIKIIYVVAGKFPKSEEFNLKQQLKRAVTSVALNIAEGKNRGSSRELAHFINNAIGSLAEVEAILLIAEELGYIKEEKRVFDEICLLSKMLKSLKTKLLQRKITKNANPPCF